MAALSARRLAWTVPATAALLAVGVAMLGVNESLFHLLNAAGARGAALWSSVTAMGDALFVLALFLPFAARRPDVLWAGLIAAVIATFFSHLFKDLFELARPAGVLGRDALHVIGPVLTKNAFPSGHTTAAFAFAGVIALSLPRLRVVAPLLAGASLVALSRVVVGAHWPVDVLGGAVVGWLSAWASVVLAKRWTWGLLRGPQLALGVFYLACAIALYDYDTGYPLALPLQHLASVACILFTAASLFVYEPPLDRAQPRGGLLVGAVVLVGLLFFGGRRGKDRP